MLKFVLMCCTLRGKEALTRVISRREMHWNHGAHAQCWSFFFFCLPPLLFRYFSLCFFCFCARLVGSFPSVDLRPLPFFFFLLHVELETFFCFDRRTSSLLMFSFFFWFYYDYYFGVSKFFCRLFCFVYRPFFGGYWIGFLEGLSLLWSKMNISKDADEEIWIFLFVPHPHRF